MKLVKKGDSKEFYADEMDAVMSDLVSDDWPPFEMEDYLKAKEIREARRRLRRG